MCTQVAVVWWALALDTSFTLSQSRAALLTVCWPVSPQAKTQWSRGRQQTQPGRVGRVQVGDWSRDREETCGRMRGLQRGPGQTAKR